MNAADAFELLEKAGKKNGKATERLKDACSALAVKIGAIVPHNEVLPRGYIKVWLYAANQCQTEAYKTRYLICVDGDEQHWIDGDGESIYQWITRFPEGEYPALDDVGDRAYLPTVPYLTAQGAHKFARDVAEGWLQELADWLEQRTTRAEEAAEKLEETEVGRERAAAQ